MTLGLVVFFCAVTWFMTMFFYTDRYKVLLHDHHLVELKCSHCTRRFVISKDNLRTPMYCELCK